MFARATRLRAPTESADAGVQQFQEALSRFRAIPGNQGAFLLFDRESGKGMGVTLWESEQAMVESQQQAQQLREQAAEQARGQIESVDEYEVVVWDVS